MGRENAHVCSHCEFALLSIVRHSIAGNSIELFPNTNLNAKRTLLAHCGDYRTDQDTRELGLHQKV